MDVVTQGLLGGVLAQSVASKSEKKLATLIGIVSGVMADADILIQSSTDPLLNIEFHRHFSHSLFFIPFGAAIAWLLLWPFLRRQVPGQRLYLFCLMGFSLSGVLDACTSYGTHLFWPLYDERVAWHIISIIDPVFSLILLITLVLGLRIKSRQIAYTGLSLCLVYMVIGFVQLQRAQQLAENLIAARGHTVSQAVVKPTLGNLLLWRSVYVHEQKIYVDAIRLGTFGDNRIFKGASLAQFQLEKDMPELYQSSVLYQDIQRFKAFSENYVAFDPEQEQVLGDIRYSMLPNRVAPLWGIVIDRDLPQLHADYRFFRDRSGKVRQAFFNMLLGRCDAAECSGLR